MFRQKILVLILIFNSFLVYCEVLDWSINNNFRNEIYLSEGVELKNSNGRAVYYEPVFNNTNPDENTDLYLSFDTDVMTDDTGKYTIRKKDYRYSRTTSVKQSAAFFVSETNTLELVGRNNYLFEAGRNIESFNISFWIYPATMTNNEVILRIGSQFFNQQTDMIEDQSIVCYIFNGRIVWKFNGLFIGSDGTQKSVTVEGYSRINLKEWNSVVMSYNEFTGLTKLVVNGVEDGVALVTSDGTTRGNVLPLRYNIRNQCRIVIGESYIGGIDEFYINRGLTGERQNNANSNNRIVSRVFQPSRYGGRISNPQYRYQNRNNSDVFFYIRCSDQPFAPDSYGTTRLPERIPLMDFLRITGRLSSAEREFIELMYLREDYDYVLNRAVQERDKNNILAILMKYGFFWKNINNIANSQISGKYFQWQAVFMPGSSSTVSSTFMGLTLNFTPYNPPSKPQNLEVAFIDGKIYLKWTLNSEQDLKGYMIYYGNASGEYFGSNASEGGSPIRIGKVNNYIITGINDRRIYYFRITAYNDDNAESESEFSDEVFVRPYNN